jgi:hypothetical protein
MSQLLVIPPRTKDDNEVNKFYARVCWLLNHLPTGTGTGDVVGPGSSTDNIVVRFDGTTGKLIQGSPILVEDDNEMKWLVSGVAVASIKAANL